MIIAVDFDGTLHDAEYPNIGEPVKDAVEMMRRIHEDGHHHHLELQGRTVLR